jgi:hypothetical protein
MTILSVGDSLSRWFRVLDVQEARWRWESWIEMRDEDEAARKEECEREGAAYRCISSGIRNGRMISPNDFRRRLVRYCSRASSRITSPRAEFIRRTRGFLVFPAVNP